MSAKKKNEDFGSYIILNGQRISLAKHPSEFSLIGPSQVLAADDVAIEPLAQNMARVRVADDDNLEEAMMQARTDSVAHHVYEVEDTDEEIVITDQIILEFQHEGTGLLEELMQEFALLYKGRLGNAHVLQVTDASARNPLKVANEIAERAGVKSCTPEVMLELQYHREPALAVEQWYLAADLVDHADVAPGCDIQALEAWEITKGDPEIVIAVVDDGFDLGHPALRGVRLHPQSRDFRGRDSVPQSEDLILNGRNQGDFHGTSVASIAVGTHQGSAMRGLAPNCTFMPIRIGFGPMAGQVAMITVFRHVSRYADVVNCSFGLPPHSQDRLHPAFRQEITELTRTGGRRGKGIVMIFSAANDDAPTFLEGVKNVNGVRYVNMASRTINEVPAGDAVYSGYPMTEGVIVVGAMSSRKRKSGYSNWGPHLTVTAPSNNMHYITSFIGAGTDPRRNLFIANYRGLGQVAASNRPGHGRPFTPIRGQDDPNTPDWEENLYTRNFGGTSGAAPIVAGIAGLMLSVNPELTASQVRQILAATADKDLDFTLDLTTDPNLQGIAGDFANGYSQYFGHGKVNAAKAVQRARLFNLNFLGATSYPNGQTNGRGSPRIGQNGASFTFVSNVAGERPTAAHGPGEELADELPVNNETGEDDANQHLAPMLLPDVRSRVRWNPSPHHSSRGGFLPEAVVVHIAEGPFPAIGNWFKNPIAQVSAHYGVGQQGQIDQYVAEERAAWHGGNVLRPTWGLLKAGINPNRYTIGIEHAGFATDAWTDIMYETSASLVRDICDRWNIPLDRNHIIGHREIFAGKTCPGFNVSLDKLIQLAGGHVTSSSTGNGGASGGPAFHIVQRGDTLFGIANLHGTTVATLLQLNPEIVDADRIFVGQRIRLPQ